MSAKYLMIGEVLRPQGVRGEVKVRPITCRAGDASRDWSWRCTPGSAATNIKPHPARLSIPGRMTALRMSTLEGMRTTREAAETPARHGTGRH